MAVRIRLQRRGAHKRPYYHIVVADSRAPRGGKFIEKVGIYSPLTQPPEIRLETERYQEWIRKGALPTDTVARLIRKASRSEAASKKE
ncbi:MAG: 30S ribosomal protein S16 [bacterium]